MTLARHIATVAFVSMQLHPAEADPLSQGGQLAAACASCHGEQPPSAIGPLTGMDAAQIESMLLKYRSGQRRGQIMRGVAMALSLNEIAEVARYLGSRRPEAVR